MYERAECPECGSFNTRREMTDFESDVVVEVRTCNDCPTEYQLTYFLELKEVTYTEDGSDSP